MRTVLERKALQMTPNRAIEQENSNEDSIVDNPPRQVMNTANLSAIIA